MCLCARSLNYSTYINTVTLSFLKEMCGIIPQRHMQMWFRPNSPSCPPSDLTQTLASHVLSSFIHSGMMSRKRGKILTHCLQSGGTGGLTTSDCGVCALPQHQAGHLMVQRASGAFHLVHLQEVTSLVWFSKEKNVAYTPDTPTVSLLRKQDLFSWTQSVDFPENAFVAFVGTFSTYECP